MLAHERKVWQDPEKILGQIQIRSGMVVADLGCGPGCFTVPIARRIEPEGIVYAVDSSARMLEYLRSNLQRSKVKRSLIKVINSDVAKTKIPSASIDFTVIANILHDVEDKDSFLQEVRRISKPKSKLLDVDWIGSETQVGPPLEIRLGEESARKILKENGFLVTKKIKSGPYHYGLICEIKS